MRVLVVDDSRTMRKIICRMMGDLGLVTAEAEHGQIAWEILQSDSDFDVVLIDWNMPEMNGYELVQTIRADPSYAAMKLMMVTTEAEIERMVQVMDAGADEYVMKPFTKEVVSEKLKVLGIPIA